MAEETKVVLPLEEKVLIHQKVAILETQENTDVFTTEMTLWSNTKHIADAPQKLYDAIVNMNDEALAWCRLHIGDMSFPFTIPCVPESLIITLYTLKDGIIEL